MAGNRRGRLRVSPRIVVGLLASLTALYAFQMPFRTLISQEGYNNEPLPADYLDHNEFVIGRLMFPGGGPEADGYYPRFQGDYRHGLSLWTQDYPRADRHLARAMRRLTRIDVRSVEQVVALDDDDDAFNFPWIYAVQVGEWGLTEAQAKVRQRERVDPGAVNAVSRQSSLFTTPRIP